MSNTNGAAQEAKTSSLYEAMMAQAAAKTKHLEIFGQQVEVRQPTMEEFRALQGRFVVDETNPDEIEAMQKDPDKMLWEMVAHFTFVPGTDELVFPDADAVKKLPFGADANKLIEAVGGIASLSAQVDDQTKNLDGTSKGSPS